MEGGVLEFPVFGVLDHFDEHANDGVVGGVERTGLIGGEVVAGNGVLEPGLGFGGFSFGIRQFGDKGGRITTFAPSFGDVCRDRAGTTADLVGERIALFYGERLCEGEEGHGGFETQFVNLQFGVFADNGAL